MSDSYSSYSSRSKKAASSLRRIEFRPLRQQSSDDEDEIELLSRTGSHGVGGGGGGQLKRRSPTVATAASSFTNSAFTTSTAASSVGPKFFIEHKLQPDVDTLLGLSLRYSCSVADLKRLNGLIADQDLFGLKVVKIPVSPFGTLKPTGTTADGVTGSGIRVSTSPTEMNNNDADTRPERFFSKIDSSMQESFFWLAKKPLAPIPDEQQQQQSSPKVIISTSNNVGDRSALAFPRASLPNNRLALPTAIADDDSGCGKWTICLIVAAFVFVFALVPVVYFLAVEERSAEERAHKAAVKAQELQLELETSNNNTGAI